jgi:NAD(P)-dependent dehydrogenase (short-subunit alcohol dehydrogenase family)
MSYLFGKVVVITGATGNLGSAVARVFAAESAQLALVDLNEERLEQAVTSLTGVQAAGFKTDLTDPESIDGLIDSVTARFGQIDILVHTVGGYAAGKPVHEAGVDVLDRMYNLNVRPLYLIGGAVARHMVERSVQGRLIFVLAKAGLKGAKNQAAYTASKAAAIRIMESMAAELREHDIKVNGISPSTIDTPANREAMPNADPGNWVTVDQLANGILFLAQANTGVYGTNLEVYGKGG